jgi:hypothetical protein
VWWKLSGEYWKTISVSVSAASRLQRVAAPTASSVMPSRSSRNTTRRCVVEVELYRCTIARDAPSIASYVRSISSGRAWVSTAIVVSSGIMSPSTSWRQNSKSVMDALGKPTSISFTPSRRSRSKKRRFRIGSIGLTSAWFPSRRSVEHQVGARSSTTSGQVRSDSETTS